MRKTKFFALILAWMMLATAVVIPAYATVDGPSDANGQWTFDDTAWETENYTVPVTLSGITQKNGSSQNEKAIWVNPDTSGVVGDWAVVVDYRFTLGSGMDERPRVHIDFTSGKSYEFDFQYRPSGTTDKLRVAVSANGTQVNFDRSDNQAILNSSSGTKDVWSNNLSSEIQTNIQGNAEYRVTIGYLDNQFLAIKSKVIF